MLLLFAMIRSVVKSFKVPDVEVAAARMSNESALTRMTYSKIINRVMTSLNSLSGGGFLGSYI